MSTSIGEDDAQTRPVALICWRDAIDHQGLRSSFRHRLPHQLNRPDIPPHENASATSSTLPINVRFGIMNK